MAGCVTCNQKELKFVDRDGDVTKLFVPADTKYPLCIMQETEVKGGARFTSLMDLTEENCDILLQWLLTRRRDRDLTEICALGKVYRITVRKFNELQDLKRAHMAKHHRRLTSRRPSLRWSRNTVRDSPNRL